MSLRDEIKPYIDGNGLVAPNSVPPGTKRASDNGPLFTSQYLILLAYNKESMDLRALLSIYSCIDANKLLHRAPDDTTEGNPDNHYGVLSMINALDLKVPPIKLPVKCWHPALIYLKLLADRNPLVSLLSPLVAIIIATSNIKEATGDTGHKMLTWVLIQGTSKSLLCRYAGRHWCSRMIKIYGDIKWIPRIYFEAGHPITKYFK